MPRVFLSASQSNNDAQSKVSLLRARKRKRQAVLAAASGSDSDNEILTSPPQSQLVFPKTIILEDQIEAENSVKKRSNQRKEPEPSIQSVDMESSVSEDLNDSPSSSSSEDVQAIPDVELVEEEKKVEQPKRKKRERKNLYPDFSFHSNQQIMSGPWTQNEQKQLLEGVSLFGKCASDKISSLITTRTPVQVSLCLIKLCKGEHEDEEFQGKFNEADQEYWNYLSVLRARKDSFDSSDLLSNKLSDVDRENLVKIQKDPFSFVKKYIAREDFVDKVVLDSFTQKYGFDLHQRDVFFQSLQDHVKDYLADFFQVLSKINRPDAKKITKAQVQRVIQILDIRDSN